MRVIEDARADGEDRFDVLPFELFFRRFQDIDEPIVDEQDRAVVGERQETAWRGIEQLIHRNTDASGQAARELCRYC